MKRHNIEFLWGWFDALRRRDAEAMTEALDPDVVWQGIREDLVCQGPQEVVAAFVEGYDADQEIDSLELLGTETHVVLGVRSPDLGDIDGIDLGGEIYNVFAISDHKITRIEDYLRREEALAAAGRQVS
ncbi:hypothetical protein BH20ACT18_BH20ACT18_03870 [soil metagenome]